MSTQQKGSAWFNFDDVISFPMQPSRAQSTPEGANDACVGCKVVELCKLKAMMENTLSSI